MALSNKERQRRWMEKNRAAFNLRRRNARKGLIDVKEEAIVQTKSEGIEMAVKEILKDEDSGSMLCPACGGYEEHKEGCEGKPKTKKETLEVLRRLIGEPQKPPETLEDAAVIVETRSASDVARGIWRNDNGAIISKFAWDKLQRMKEHAKANNFEIDDYSQ